MAVFLSTFVNRIDKKGRVSVPASFRAVLGPDAPGIVVAPRPRFLASQLGVIGHMHGAAIGFLVVHTHEVTQGIAREQRKRGGHLHFDQPPGKQYDGPGVSLLRQPDSSRRQGHHLWRGRGVPRRHSGGPGGGRAAAG